jgi:hypothetical protein
MKITANSGAWLGFLRKEHGILKPLLLRKIKVDSPIGR